MTSISRKCILCMQLLILFSLSRNAVSNWIVKTLPGFSGDLPFTLETGYVSVGEIEFFYYFVESSSGYSPTDPLILYLNGGPGCSGLNGLLFQVGPLEFNLTYTGGIPELLYTPYSWTKSANIIFIDAPIGTGFSYATNAEAYASSDTLTSADMVNFMRNWLNEHPKFGGNPFFINSDSYAGILVPLIAQAIINENEAGVEPRINIRGYILSCAHTATDVETDSKIVYAHRMALISDALYETAKTSCNGSYADVDSSNAACLEAIEAIELCIQDISPQNILSPECAFLSPNANEEKDRRSLVENSRNSLLSSFKSPDLECHNFEYLLSDIWANFKSVQEALHVRPNTTKEWFRCNVSLSYSVDVNDVVPYHLNLTNTGLQILAFSGDHDMVIPHVAIEGWVKSLDLTIDSDWRPWFVQGQVAGYTRKYTNDGYRFTYATIKGAGHSPHEWNRKVCYDMFHRWSNYFPL
ncbi:serine carboxypeptidase-like 18 [Cornus florida]|uniref:serine carboxypeptidase-like 18 n=1 Tax=Cornus florida TaxID=4283 RepID=UPI00289B7A5B|nr:serine carboxypeptidase-like 18 [Cornus florida]